MQKENFKVPPDEMFTMECNGRKFFIDQGGNKVTKVQNGKAVINKEETLMTIYRVIDNEYKVEKYKLSPKKRG